MAATSLGAFVGLVDDAPQQRLPVGHDREAAQLAPELERLAVVELERLAVDLERLLEALLAGRDRGGEVLDAQRRHRLAHGLQAGVAEAGGDGRLQVHRARDLDGERHRRAHELGRQDVGQAEEDDGRRRLRPGQHLERHLGQHRERAPASGEPARHVVAGHVLHDAAAGVEQLGAAVDALDAEQVIAGGAGLDAARARQVGREHGADRLHALRAARRRAEVDRLEGEHLPLRGELGLDQRHRRAGARRHHELARLIEGDAAQQRGGDHDGAVDRAADRRAWSRHPRSRWGRSSRRSRPP